MKVREILIVFSVICFANSNVWDNIYSQTKADTPIILTQSLNFQFKVKEYSLKIVADFNSELQTITVFVKLDVVVQIEIMNIQLDLSNLVFTINRINSPCERYSLPMAQNVSLQKVKVSKERLFISNIFFKYIGNKDGSKLSRQFWNIYKLEPYLFTVPQDKLGDLNDLKEELKDNLGQDIDYNEDFLPDIQLFLHINPATGSIEGIFSGQNQGTNVPFNTFSKIKRKYTCEAPAKTLSSGELKSIFEFVKDNANF